MNKLSQAQASYPSPVITPPTLHHRSPNNLASGPVVRILAEHFRAHRAPKRHRRILRDNLPAALNKPTIRRLARRGGVKRIKSEIYGTVQQVIKKRLAEIIEPAIMLAEHRGQKTLTALDVVYVLRQINSPIYGFGTIIRGDNINSRADYMKRRRAANAQNVRDTQARLEREERERQIDAHVRRLGGSVNLRRR